MVLTIVFGLVTAAAAAYAFFEARILVGYWRSARRGAGIDDEARPATPARHAPSVAVQLPLYNEGPVALDLIRAVCDFDYPRDRLQIQVLDDSDDHTPSLVAPEIERLRAAGFEISHMRRTDRAGWKAGALAEGLSASEAEFVVIFDADFVPPRDYLRRVLIEGDVFDDPSVAFLQGRWTYTNEHQSVLTRAQAILIDRHFVIQKPFQIDRGLTTTFNGSAGIWRRTAIDAVGGWSADTLCEDLDLSYRCALVGLRGAYEKSLECPSEIPSSIIAFKLQQRRWAKGSAQCMRKLTRRIVESRTLRSRWDDLYSVVGYVIHPILFFYVLLWPWVVLQDVPAPVIAAGQICLTVANVIAISGFLLTTIDSQRRIGLGSTRDVIFALALGMTLMVNNTVAFFVGCFERMSIFERTPKRGRAVGAVSSSSHLRLHWTIKIEIAFVVYMMWVGALLIDAGHAAHALPCFMFGLGMAGMVLYQFAERFSGSMARLARAFG